jgi:hypothetical protein
VPSDRRTGSQFCINCHLAIIEFAVRFAVFSADSDTLFEDLFSEIYLAIEQFAHLFFLLSDTSLDQSTMAAQGYAVRGSSFDLAPPDPTIAHFTAYFLSIHKIMLLVGLLQNGELI